MGDDIGSFFREGLHHVLIGWDHLLFAVALVLALRSFWEVFKVIGIFTVAHSLTVSLTVWHGSPLLPAHIVEPCIAASIIIVALENIFFPDSAMSGRRMLVAFGFGLVHGMGLAGALLASLEGIDTGRVVRGVIAFCIGVEVGHLCIVAPASGLLKIGRDLWQENFRKWSLIAGSALVACGGVYYLLAALGFLPSPEA